MEGMRPFHAFRQKGDAADPRLEKDADVDVDVDADGFSPRNAQVQKDTDVDADGFSPRNAQVHGVRQLSSGKDFFLAPNAEKPQVQEIGTHRSSDDAYFSAARDCRLVA